MDETIAYDPWTRWFAGIAAVLLSLLLVMFSIAAVRGPSVNERLTEIEEQMTVVTCLLLITPDERLERGAAECQTLPPGP